MQVKVGQFRGRAIRKRERKWKGHNLKIHLKKVPVTKHILLLSNLVIKRPHQRPNILNAECRSHPRRSLKLSMHRDSKWKQEILVNKAEVMWEEWTGGHWLKETRVLFKTEGEGANVFCRELSIYPCGLLSLIWMMVGCKCTQAEPLTTSQEICNDKYMNSRTLPVRKASVVPPFTLSDLVFPFTNSNK